jgi:tyrosine-protein kinase Etk/Wzc
MEALAAELRATYPRTIVIFDSAPLLMAAEPLTLARLVGQVLLIVRAGVTLEAVLEEGIGRLESVGSTPSLILNQWHPNRLHDAGYYGQYGEYGQAPG